MDKKKVTSVNFEMDEQEKPRITDEQIEVLKQVCSDAQLLGEFLAKVCFYIRRTTNATRFKAELKENEQISDRISTLIMERDDAKAKNKAMLARIEEILKIESIWVQPIQYEHKDSDGYPIWSFVCHGGEPKAGFDYVLIAPNITLEELTGKAGTGKKPAPHPTGKEE